MRCTSHSQERLLQQCLMQPGVGKGICGSGLTVIVSELTAAGMLTLSAVRQQTPTIVVMAMVAVPAAIPSAPAMAVVVVVVPVMVAVMVAPAPVQQMPSVMIACTGAQDACSLRQRACRRCNSQARRIQVKCTVKEASPQALWANSRNLVAPETLYDDIGSGTPRTSAAKVADLNTPLRS